MVDANILAPMLVNHAALPLLRAGGNGHVFNLTTVEGRLPMPGVAGYAATMAAVVAYTDSLRKDIGREGIRVTLVMTGGDVPGDDVGNAIADAMAQPPHVVLNELLLRPMGPAR
jgi:NADP-dependent 3-hydroxy acid dehydrogenase YdfG